MCDFRNIIGVKFADGTEFHGKPQGHYSWFDECVKDDPKPGLYHIGMTGCGIYYYEDGTFWSDYQMGSMMKCEFILGDPEYNLPDGVNVQRYEPPNN